MKTNIAKTPSEEGVTELTLQNRSEVSVLTHICNYILQNDSVNICFSFHKENQKAIKFDLDFGHTGKSKNVSGIAELILLEDDDGNLYSPEGTFILDENTNEDYLCDSTYGYNSKEINISFGFEKISAKRLSLVIYNSKVPGIKDNEYTLYKAVSKNK